MGINENFVVDFTMIREGLVPEKRNKNKASLTWGIPAAPMLARVAVMEMATMSPKLVSTSYTWAM